MRMIRDAFLIGLAAILPIALSCATPPTRATENEERSAGNVVDDAMTTARVKTAFLFNRHLNSFRINVDTQDGLVTLQGVVKSDIQRDLAGEIAKNASGVRKVANELQVTGGAVDEPDEVDRTFSQAVLDATTTATVKTALGLAKGVRGTDITVTTRWGSVTLTGQVRSHAEKGLAARIVRDCDGVKEVVNRLEVRDE